MVAGEVVVWGEGGRREVKHIYAGREDEMSERIIHCSNMSQLIKV